MADWDDTETPSEEDLELCYGAKYLSGTEHGDKIARVRKQALQQQGGGTKTKFILAFTTVDKEMVLNSTNKNALVDVLGKRPADWIGAEVGIYTESTTYSGKPTRGLRLRVLNKPATTSPPKASAQPAPKLTAAEKTLWPDQPDDPGPDFIDAAE